jgi:hypothetical protein
MVFAFDTLAYARRLRDAGIPTPEAEAHADAAREFIMAELVTKPDMLAVREEIATAKIDLRAEIGAVRTELIATKRDLQESIAVLRREMIAAMANADLRATVRLGTMLTVAIGILAAIIKL